MGRTQIARLVGGAGTGKTTELLQVMEKAKAGLGGSPFALVLPRLRELHELKPLLVPQVLGESLKTYCKRMAGSERLTALLIVNFCSEEWPNAIEKQRVSAMAGRCTGCFCSRDD